MKQDKQDDSFFPVSVAIVTRDEEKNIEDALKSVSDADEIIVIDAFSSDRTVEICRKYTGKVYQFEWEGYSRQKQKAVDLTSGEWVLVLDADERVSPELKKEIVDILASGTAKNGFYIPRKNYFLGRWIRHGGWWPDYTLRLFRKDHGHFEDREVHEKILLNGDAGYFRNPLIHYTYWSMSDFISRMDKYASLSASEAIRNSKRAGLFSLLVRPAATFFKMYFLRLGIADGSRGFILAVLYSFYTFVKYAKIWENRS